MAEEEPTTESAESVASYDQPNPKHRNRKPKPWDHDDIDHWKLDPYSEDDSKGNTLVDETVFSTLFPKYRETYLREWWAQITQELKKYHLDCTLDLIEGSMSVRTTRKTWDPYIVIKARDMLKLLARSVSFQQAIRVLGDDVTSDIIKIGNITRNKERFVKRRQRLLGPNGATLKAIELLTECYILVQGNTVSAIGPFKGLKQVRKIVIECMNNIHPVYTIKTLMIRRELEKKPELKNENWDRFLPKFKKKNAKSKTEKKVSKKKEREVFPPAPTPRQEDIDMESGLYFLKDNEKKDRIAKEKKAKSAANTGKKQEKRAKAFEAPKEPTRQSADAAHQAVVDVAKLKAKLSKTDVERKRKAHDVVDDYVIKPAKQKKQKDD
eukprot:m.24914 g.24914  ORF g.24914 m.24914 type:complete len:381 (-) comp36782_c0_seq2:102-1244(-)